MSVPTTTSTTKFDGQDVALGVDLDRAEAVDEPARPTGASEESKAPSGDALVTGISLMLVMTVFQRGFGFVRNVLVCRFLDPTELGLWNLAETTLILCAPLIVLGVPGTLVRYVEHFRQRGQLRPFLTRIGTATLLLASLGVAVMAVNQEWFATVALGGTQAAFFVPAILATLFVVIAFNFMSELLMSLRQVKAVAYVNFANSITFGILAVSLLYFTELRALGVVLSYGIACLLTTTGAMWLLRNLGACAPSSSASQTSFWAKILPFAGWIWVTDLLDNTFNAADRYMIVHFSGLEEDAALGLVGQYHCSRILGVLLISVATMLSNVLVPYLAHDWEQDRRRRVWAKMNLGFKLIGVTMIWASAAVIAFGPFIFGKVLGGAYMEGFRVLPWTMVYCVWTGLVMFGQSYLFCAEQGGLRAAAIGLGLLSNVVLNWLLLPHYGLVGAVWATSIANLVTLSLVLYFCRRNGLYVSTGVIVVVLSTLSLLLPPAATVLVLGGIFFAAFHSRRLLSRWERRQLTQMLTRLKRFVPVLRAT